MAEDKVCCETCMYLNAGNECVRHAPQVLSLKDRSPVSPEIAHPEWDWCGEYINCETGEDCKAVMLRLAAVESLDSTV